MPDQLPIIRTTSATTVLGDHSNTLIGRGLSAIQNQNNNLITADLDTQYRQARDVYDQITEPTWYSTNKHPHWSIAQSETLQSCFITFLSLADQGYSKTYYPLSIFYRGSQCVPEDKQQAKKYAQLAFNWYFNNQFQNDPEIWSDLGMMYKWSEVTEPDIDLTVFWCQKAAENNNANAQCRLGYMYDIGPEKGRNNIEAVYWYHKSAVQGHSYAQYRLAFMYRQGSGIKKNYNESIYWYIKAAEQGLVGAQRKLGLIYQIGRGVEQDDIYAIYWLQKAAAQEDITAQEKLKELGIDWKTL